MLALALLQKRGQNLYMLGIKEIRTLPKVELHEHLDGSVRPSTVITLAEERNIALPEDNEERLAAWFCKGSERKSLSLYLESFGITTAIMQDTASLKRIAMEEIEDLAADGVVYAEIRFAPSLHTRQGLSMDEVIRAVLDGLQEGRMRTGVEFGLILCAMRHESPEISQKVAELCAAYAERGVVGFDLAGDESGNPAKNHIKAFEYIRRKNFNITIHAGEAFGTESIWQAIQICGAHRIGHGTRLIDDMKIENGKIMKMGSLAHFVLDKRIPLEMCLTSNVGTGAVESYDTHPFPLFLREKFRVFLCTDNRLMSGTSLSNELSIAAQHYHLDINDIEKITINAMKSAFCHHDKKLGLIYDVIKKGYTEKRAAWGL